MLFDYNLRLEVFVHSLVCAFEAIAKVYVCSCVYVFSTLTSVFIGPTEAHIAD